jgi:phage terminase large subunit-like protein
LPPKLRLKLLATADSRFLEFFDKDVELFAHASQLPPSCASGGGAWTTWLFLGGRGAGKTWAGARWVRGLALGLPPFAAQLEVMVEGV